MNYMELIGVSSDKNGVKTHTSIQVDCPEKNVFWNKIKFLKEREVLE